MCGCTNIKIKFIEDPVDPAHHFTLNQVYQVVAAAPFEGGFVGLAVINDLGVLQTIRSDNTVFELVSVIVPGDDVQLYP